MVRLLACGPTSAKVAGFLFARSRSSDSCGRFASGSARRPKYPGLLSRKTYGCGSFDPRDGHVLRAVQRHNAPPLQHLEMAEDLRDPKEDFLDRKSAE